jgi:hypothetical protein
MQDEWQRPCSNQAEVRITMHPIQAGEQLCEHGIGPTVHALLSILPGDDDDAS